MGTTADKLSYLQATKTAIKNAITAKGVAVGENDTFRSYAQKIESIEGEPTLKVINTSFYAGNNITAQNTLVNSSATGLINLNNLNTTSNIVTNNAVTLSGSWEIVLAILRAPTRTSGESSNRALLGAYSANYSDRYKYPIVSYSRDNTSQIELFMSGNGSSWNVASDKRVAISGTQQYIKLAYNSTSGQYTLATAQLTDDPDNADYTINNNTFSGSAVYQETSLPLYFGVNLETGLSQFNDGIIDFSRSYVEVNGVRHYIAINYVAPEPSGGGIEVTGNDASFTIKAGTKYNMTTYDSQTGTESTTVEELDNDITIADYQVSEQSTPELSYQAPATQSTAYGAIEAAYTGSSAQSTFTVSLSDGGVTYTNITCGKIMYSTDQSGYWSVPSSRARRAEVSGLTVGKTYTLSSGPLCSYNVVYPQYGSSTQFDIFVTDGDLSTVKYAGRVYGNTNSGTSSYYLPASNNITFSPDSSGKAYIYLVTVNSSIPFASMSTNSGTRYQVGCFREDKDMTNKTLNLSMIGYDFGSGSAQLIINLSDNMPYKEPPEDIVYTVTTDSVDGNTLVSSGETPWVQPS